MLTTMMISMLVGCMKMPPHPPPPVASTIRCEGADQVRRDSFGNEVGRWTLAPMCNQVRCERQDWVRRDVDGQELARWLGAPQCSAPQRVRLTATPGWRYGLSSS